MFRISVNPLRCSRKLKAADVVLGGAAVKIISECTIGTLEGIDISDDN
jgi:hypothetical protein